MTKLRNLLCGRVVGSGARVAERQRGRRRAEQRAGLIRRQPVTGWCWIYYNGPLVAGTLLTLAQALAVSAIMARNASVLRITICVRPSSIQPRRRQSLKC